MTVQRQDPPPRVQHVSMADRVSDTLRRMILTRDLDGLERAYLGIVDETAPGPWRTKAMADEYEGFRLLDFDTRDAYGATLFFTDLG